MIFMRWTRYRGRPAATFLSFSLNIAAFLIIAGAALIWFGLREHRPTLMAIGAVLAAEFALYSFIVAGYLKRLDVILRLEKMQAPVRPASPEWMQESEELRKIVPGFDFHEEIKNPEFAELIHEGWPIKDAYEMVHSEKSRRADRPFPRRRLRSGR